jgi:6-phosphogluconolactonase (cycloisomerase 2 family)
MTFSRIGRIVKGLVASAALGLGMTACGGGTVGYMWVLGSQPNQSAGIITGYKIDDYTGNLTAAPGSPFSSAGANPVSIVIKQGGRFVYVVNAGTPASGSTAAVPGNISYYSVGGDGSLLFQLTYTSQGSNPVWAATDTTGSYLYVLDQVAPSNTYCPAGYSSCGDITVFSIDGNTGRLTLVQNNAIKQTGTQLQLTYFPVGNNPTMVKTGSNGCVYTLSTNSVYPLAAGSGGQLTAATTGPLQFGATGGAGLPIQFSSINTGGSYTYLTDVANNTIYPLTAGATQCSLAIVNPGIVSNLSLTSNPVNSVTSSNGKYLYVINQSSTSNTQTPANSSISAFTIDATTGRLQALADTADPYSTGSGPVCVVIDTSNQYLFTSDSTSKTVTGKVIDQNTGQLSPLQRGSTFTLLGPATCLAISGNVE